MNLPADIDLKGHHEKMRLAELARANRKLAGGAPVEGVLEEFARRLTNKALHAPTKALSMLNNAERTELLSLMQRIYRLPDAGIQDSVVSGEHG